MANENNAMLFLLITVLCFSPCNTRRLIEWGWTHIKKYWVSPKCFSDLNQSISIFRAFTTDKPPKLGGFLTHSLLFSPVLTAHYTNGVQNDFGKYLLMVRRRTTNQQYYLAHVRNSRVNLYPCIKHKHVVLSWRVLWNRCRIIMDVKHKNPCKTINTPEYDTDKKRLISHLIISFFVLMTMIVKTIEQKRARLWVRNKNVSFLVSLIIMFCIRITATNIKTSLSCLVHVSLVYAACRNHVWKAVLNVF